MRESVLLMNFKDKKQLKGIQMIAFLLKVKIRMVGERDFLQPIGYLEHKAILTPTNVHWNTIELYEELEQERQAMEAAAREREHVDVKERSDL